MKGQGFINKSINDKGHEVYEYRTYLGTLMEKYPPFSEYTLLRNKEIGEFFNL